MLKHLIEQRFAPTLWSVVAVLLIGGCTGSSYTPATNAPSYPAYEGEVKVMNALPRAGSFERLGTLVVTGPRLVTDEALLEDLKAAAAENGANAVVLQHEKIKVRQKYDGGEERMLGAWAIRLKL